MNRKLLGFSEHPDPGLPRLGPEYDVPHKPPYAGRGYYNYLELCILIVSC